MAQHKLTDLKRTAGDRTAAKALYETPIDQDEYDYGLRISLGDEELEKLGIKKLEVGKKVIITAAAEVIEFSENESDSGKRRRVELQIQKMDITQGSTNAISALYGDDSG